jgi:outer membrane autotransporter protein
VDVANDGDIIAAAYGADVIATGVRMTSGGTNTLVNTGSIVALGDGLRIAIASGDGAQAAIDNQGTLVGAITTGELDDLLVNGGSWRAVGTSDFGAGSDVVANAGTIHMDDATIRLGGSSEGDAFSSSGLIAVSGNANTFELPGSSFTNTGVISFFDGAADDTLSILGDFAGDGAIRLDVSGLAQAGDRLYIDGDVTGTQALDVDFSGAPTSANLLIPLVSVSGDSNEGSFALGDVAFAGGGFLSLDFSLDAAIDASNASADVFSLGVAVTGLNDAGALAAVFAPGAQGVVDAQVGSYRQRRGAVTRPQGAVLEPWLRVFSDGGDFTPGHAGNFGAGGHFGYHQSNRGWELGLDTRPSEHLALGALIASSEGSQRLDAGLGRADLDGRTFGLYATWLAGGFYFDVSQRWVGIDARLDGAAGAARAEATAHVFNLEAGYTAWTVGGLHVEPQLQYTHSRNGDIEDLRSGTSTFANDGGLSSRVRLGLAFDKTFEGASFDWTPFGTVSALRELDGEYEHAINGGLQGTTSLEGTSTQLELGLEARKSRLSVTGSVHWTDGGAVDGRTGGQLTVRYRW